MSVKKIHLRDLELLEIERIINDKNLPLFRSKQLFQWVHQKAAINWAAMANLPLELRREFSLNYEISGPTTVKKELSEEDGTVKYLLALKDGETVETVLMDYQDRKTVCISSQVGCPLACEFCATGKSGYKRNLKVHEVLDQVLTVNRDLVQEDKLPVTNIVFMGMGEPLLNYQVLLKSMRILNHPLGLNISFRKMSVSTSGIVPEIYRLAKEGLPLVLAISLHAPNNYLRNQLMPVNRKYPLEELIKAADFWIKETGRRITFEYILIEEVNDGLKEARELGSLLKGLLANVNLIPFNPVPGTNFKKPSLGRVSRFQQFLMDKGIAVTIRGEKGGDISGACGQLRRREMGN